MKKRMFLSIVLAGLLSVGMFAIAVPVPAAYAAPAKGHTIVINMSGPSASAGFIIQRGDVTIFMDVSAALNGIQGPVSITGPAVGVSIIEANNVTGEQLNGVGMAPAPGLTIGSKDLTSASLPATDLMIEPTQDNPGAFAPYLLHMGAISWTGEGLLTFTSQITHIRIPHVANVANHSSGVSRMAMATLGSISYISPLDGAFVQFTTLTSNFAQLNRDRSKTTIVMHAAFP